MRRCLFNLAVLLVAASPLLHADNASAVKPNILDNVGIVQKLGDQLPLNLPFKDETGAPVTLGHYFQDHRPVILAFVYYECPMLCTEILNGLTRTMRAMPLSAGKDFQVVTVSFDPRETPKLAAQKKMKYIDAYRRAGADKGWAFLTGDESSIKALTKAAGFSYAWDPKLQQFAHASTIMIVTPEGKLSRYFYGVEYPTQDVRLSLVEASSNKIGTFIDQVTLYCYHYDPTTGRYGLIITRVLQVVAAATLLGLIALIGTLLWFEKKHPKENHA